MRNSSHQVTSTLLYVDWLTIDLSDGIVGPCKTRILRSSLLLTHFDILITYAILACDNRAGLYLEAYSASCLRM